MRVPVSVCQNDGEYMREGGGGGGERDRMGLWYRFLQNQWTVDINISVG